MGGNPDKTVDQEKAHEDFLVFFEDMYMELSKFGPIEGLHVCDNLGDHIIGHVYCKFRDEEMASDALEGLMDRYYDGRQCQVEFSPVTDFREARCRDYDEDYCLRGGFCNFLHFKPVPTCLIRSLEEDAGHGRRKHRRRKRGDGVKDSEEEEEEENERRRRRRRHERKEHDRKGSSSRRHRDDDDDDDSSEDKDNKNDDDDDDDESDKDESDKDESHSSSRNGDGNGDNGRDKTNHRKRNGRSG